MVSPSPKILSDSGERLCRLVLNNCNIMQCNDGEMETLFVHHNPVHPVVYLTDKQILPLLHVVIGRGKVIDQKQLWAGVYWFLRWYSNFPVDPKKFCLRINAISGAELFEIPCCYENIRKLAFLGFMSCDARKMDEVRYSNNDSNEFSLCREVVLTLTEILLKMGL